MPNNRISSGRRVCGDELHISVDNPDSLSSKHNHGVARNENDRPLHF